MENNHHLFLYARYLSCLSITAKYLGFPGESRGQGRAGDGSFAVFGALHPFPSWGSLCEILLTRSFQEQGLCSWKWVSNISMSSGWAPPEMGDSWVLPSLWAQGAAGAGADSIRWGVETDLPKKRDLICFFSYGVFQKYPWRVGLAWEIAIPERFHFS